MKTPVVAELPSKRIRRQRQESRAKRALAAAVLVSYRHRAANGEARVATALTRWVGR